MIGYLKYLRFQKCGLSYNSSNGYFIKSPCGLKNGNAEGLLIFTELYHKTKNEIFKSIVYKLHGYQKSCWVSELKNWGDFRYEINNASNHFQNIEYIRTGNSEIFLKPKDSTCLEYGTIGIVKVYLFMYWVFNEKYFLKEAKKGMKKLKYCLNLKDFKDIRKNIKIKANVNMDQIMAQKIFLSHFYPQSFQLIAQFDLLDKIKPLHFDGISFFRYMVNLNNNFKELFSNIKDKRLQAYAKEIYKLEKAKNQLIYLNQNTAILRAEELQLIYSVNHILKNSNEELKKYQFELSDRLYLIISNFRIKRNEEVFDIEMLEQLNLLKRTSFGILETEIQKIELCLLQKFVEAKSIFEAVNEYFIDIELDTIQSPINEINNTFEIIRKLIFSNYIINKIG